MISIRTKTDVLEVRHSSNKNRLKEWLIQATRPAGIIVVGTDSKLKQQVISTFSSLANVQCLQNMDDVVKTGAVHKDATIVVSLPAINATHQRQRSIVYQQLKEMGIEDIAVVYVFDLTVKIANREERIANERLRTYRLRLMEECEHSFFIVKSAAE